MAERLDTVVIGAGQAGLAVSWYLTQHDRPHVVLERGQVAETWRSQRWDSFCLNTPNFFLRLPGQEYEEDDPDGYLTRDDTVAYLAQYAERIRAPVRTGVLVSALVARSGGGYTLQTSHGQLEADVVVVTTGSFTRPLPPPVVGDAPAGLVQLQASEYQRPSDLPGGAVLVVGGGQSGCQIAEDLRRDGRAIYLSLGRCPALPERYRGRHIGRWLIDLGLMDDTVDSLPSPSARLACNPTVGSRDTPHLRGPQGLARDGVVLLGRVEALRGWTALLRADLGESLAAADEFAGRVLQRIDDHVRASGLEAPEEPLGESGSPFSTGDVGELDLQAAGIKAVVWANGYRPDFSWIGLPIFDAEGWPVQARGVTAAPGLYFVGLHWLHKRKSALLLGVGEDAEYVVSHIVGG